MFQFFNIAGSTLIMITNLSTAASETITCNYFTVINQGRLSHQTAMTQSSPPLRPYHSALFSSPPLPLLRGFGGMTPGKIFGVTEYARRRVVEHFGHKNQHLYEPGFLTVNCNCRISSKCACGTVNR